MKEIKLEKNRVYSADEVAKLLKISITTATTYCRKGKIKAHKAGRGWKVWGGNLIDYLTPVKSSPEDPETAQTIISL